MTITITKKELKDILRESIREVISEERIQIQSLLLPDVSDKEQKNIEELYGKPSRKSAKSRTIKI